MSQLPLPFVLNDPITDTTANKNTNNKYESESNVSLMNSIRNTFMSDSSSGTSIFNSEETQKPKRGRPKKDATTQETINIDINGNIAPAAPTQNAYHEAYKETDTILKVAIGQTDQLINTVTEDLAKIRESKAMTSKYRYVTDLSQTISSLIATKISAARELNSSISHAADMEYKMQKELKALEGVKDDNKAIMDMYNAFVSMPVGTYNPGFGPSIQDMTLPKGTNVNAITIDPNMTSPNSDPGYQNYINNLTPEQNRMRMERNPNIQTVVFYDQATSRKWFEVIDVTTGNVVPNMPKPDDMILEDTRPDLTNKVARNANINVTYPLIVVGERGSIYDY